MNYGKNHIPQKRTSLQPKYISKGKRRLFGILKASILIMIIISLIGAAGGALVFKKIIDNTPKISAESLKPTAYTTTAYASDGTTLIGNFVTAGAHRYYKTLDDIPTHLQKAFIAIEDERFYKHDGVDWKGVIRSAVVGVTSGNFSQGGSTITQQLIKNSVFPDFVNETTWEKIQRKVQEIYLALQVEQILEKDDILEYYLNTINLGQNTLGIESASQRYFGKSVEELTLSEAATIAAITQNPSGHDPIVNPQTNAARRKTVLNKMLKQGYISNEEYQEALADDVYTRIQEHNAEYKAGLSANSYFLDEVAKVVMNDLCQKLGYTRDQAYRAVYSGGLKIITTQDATMQKICEEELNNAANYPSKTEWTVTGAISILHVDGTQNHYDHGTFGNYIKKKYNTEYGTTFKTKEDAQAKLEEYIATLKTDENDTVITNLTFSAQPQASVVIIDQYTGHIKAMVGGRGEKTVNMSLNRATQSTRQPGSTFKILSTYVPALDVSGDTLASIIIDAPYEYKNGEPVRNWWKDGYRGALTIRYCIQESANVCTVKKYTDISPTLGMRYLTKNFAFTTLDAVNDSGQATSLGGLTKGVTNLELTAAYASIANDGVYIEPIYYTHIYDDKGNLLYENIPKSHTAMKETTAALITSAMRDVMTIGTGTAARLSGVASAGKTGTTTDDKDFWLSGYTPYLTASVWGGYDDSQSMSGSTSFHKTIWRKVMQRIHDTYNLKSKTFEMPDELVTATVCKQSGQLATSESCKKYTEYFTPETVPTGECTVHGTDIPDDIPIPDDDLTTDDNSASNDDNFFDDLFLDPNE